MFDKFRQATKMKEIKNSLSQEKEEFEKNGVKVVVTGEMLVESIEISPEVSLEDAQKLVKEAVNQAFKRVQQKAAKKIQQMGFE